MHIARVEAAGRRHLVARVPADPDRVEVLEGDLYAGLRPTGATLPFAELRFLAPVEPGKVVVVGRNYAGRDGAEPGGDPVLFLRPGSAVTGHGDPIVLPRHSADVVFEGELAVVIGTRCRDLPEAGWATAVLGYTCGNDVTARDIGRATGQWSKAKSFDTFGPLGPWLATDVDVSAARVTTSVNGEVRQDGTVDRLIHPLPALIAYVSSCMTLHPGDVILTGTPPGSTPLAPGDEVAVTVGGVGTLVNPVAGGARAAA